MVYSISIENTFNNTLTKKIVDLSTISPSTITDPTIPYIEYVSDQKERLDGYVYLPLYKRNQFCIIPPNSILTIETENSDEAIFYISQKVEFSKITSSPDPITGVFSETGVSENIENKSDITKQTILDYINRSIQIESVPEGITQLGGGAFGMCKNITDIGIPEGIIYIGTSCFTDCTSLTSISLPQSLEQLDRYCFKGCSSLSTIEIPSSVESIGFNAFQNCTNLVDIYIAKEQGSISGSPWGATNATVHWNP